MNKKADADMMTDTEAKTGTEYSFSEHLCTALTGIKKWFPDNIHIIIMILLNLDVCK